MKHHFIPRLTDPDRCAVDNCDSYWNNYVIHIVEGDGSRRPESYLPESLNPGETLLDDGNEFRIVRGTISNDLFVVDRKNAVHASFARWHAGLAEETMDRLNVRRLAGRG